MRKPNNLPSITNQKWIEENCKILNPDILAEIKYENYLGDIIIFYYFKCKECNKWFFSKTKEFSGEHFFCCVKHKSKFKRNLFNRIPKTLKENDFENFKIIKEKDFKFSSFKDIEIEKYVYTYGKCTFCGEWNLVQDHVSRFKENIKNGNPSFCSNSHHVSWMNGPITCPIHGYQEKSFSGKCIKCIHETPEMKEHVRKQALKNLDYLNNEYWNSEEGKEKRKEVYKLGCIKYIGSDKQKEHLRYLNTTINNQPEIRQKAYDEILRKIKSGEFKYWPCCCVQSFITKNNVKFYKNEPIEIVIQKLESGEYSIDNFPGWNKRFGKWYYKTKDVLNDDIYLLNNSDFTIQNDVLYYFDKLNCKYILWEDYKNKFSLKTLVLSNFESEIINIYKNSQIIPTFRTQDSIDWSGSKAAFEQSLIEANIDWFVYIKFYIDQLGCIKPLVVGKTGSLNVNVNGSDVSFSEDINDGPARRFLVETGTTWDKTKILIIPCKDEYEAFNIEKEIALNYDLFES